MCHYFLICLFLTFFVMRIPRKDDEGDSDNDGGESDDDDDYDNDDGGESDENPGLSALVGGEIEEDEEDAAEDFEPVGDESGEEEMSDDEDEDEPVSKKLKTGWEK